MKFVEWNENYRYITYESGHQPNKQIPEGSLMTSTLARNSTEKITPQPLAKKGQPEGCYRWVMLSRKSISCQQSPAFSLSTCSSSASTLGKIISQCLLENSVLFWATLFNPPMTLCITTHGDVMFSIFRWRSDAPPEPVFHTNRSSSYVSS